MKTGKDRYVEIHAELKPKLLAWREGWEETFEQRIRRHPDEPDYRAEQMMRFRIYKDDERKQEQAEAGEGENAEAKGA